MEAAFVERVLGEREAKGTKKKASRYEALLGQIGAEDADAGADERAIRARVLLALARQAPRIVGTAAHAPLLDAIFACSSAAPDVVDALAQLLVAVVATNATHVGRAYDVLFRLAPSLGDDAAPGAAPPPPPPPPASQAVPATQACCRGVAALIDVCPQGTAELVAALRRWYPYSRSPVQQHRAYAELLLGLARLYPVLERTVLQLVVERALELDVEIKLDSALAPRNKPLAAEADLFSLELDGDAAAPRSKKDDDMQERANKLDTVMVIVFEYVDAVRRQPAALQRLFGAAGDIFEQAVLHTHRSKYVQFLIFYLCAQDPARLSGVFVRRLAALFGDDSVAVVTRLGAAAYAASFVCRAAFVKTSLVALCAEALLDAAEAAAATLAGMADRQAAARGRRVVHALCEALVYVVCFHGAALQQYYPTVIAYADDGRRTALDERRWDGLLFRSRLQPLRRCDPRVRMEFARTAHDLFSPAFVAQVDAAIESVSRAAPGHARRAAAHDDDAQVQHASNFFFPFDPYNLRRSSAFVDAHYRQWTPTGGDDDDDDDASEDDESDESGEESDDDDAGAQHSDSDRRRRETPVGSCSPSVMAMSQPRSFGASFGANPMSLDDQPQSGFQKFKERHNSADGSLGSW
ncbi:RNA polymerase I-specific transcription initiation factor RRN3 [Pelagophyceae sp. CCMP2097]|nr:RNA polymerase I-specific transcription initiation factor RRN3 [Pelagophyceae sp. CCMP2097]